MVDKSSSKADALRAMREANYDANHSSSRDGGSRVVDKPRPHGESLQQGADTSSKPSTAPKAQGKGSAAANVAKPQIDPASAPHQSPLPRETKLKRAPRGTFDRNAYQREYMRRKRAEKESSK